MSTLIAVSALGSKGKVRVVHMASRVKAASVALICLAVSLFVQRSAYAQTTDPETKPQAAAVKVHPPTWSDDESYADIRVELLGFDPGKLFDTKNDAVSDPEYVEFPPIVNAAVMTDIGKPELPYVAVDVEVPPSTSASVSVTALTPPDAWNAINVIPVRAPWAEYPGAERPPLRPEKPVYATNAFFPGPLVELGPRQSLRGVTVQTLYVFPVQFNPVLRRVHIHADLTVRISVSPTAFSPGSFTLKESLVGLKSTMMARKSGLYAHEFASSYLAFADGFRPFPIRPQIVDIEDATGCDYLVITPAAYVNELDRLLAPKRARGLATRIVTLTDLGVAQSDAATKRSKIRTRIEAEYKKEPAPRYLLLVGDSKAIPPYKTSTHPSDSYATGTKIPTDLYYSTLDGSDPVPDILVGRLPASSTAQLRTMIDKILAYENAVRTNEAAQQPWGTMLVSASYENKQYIVNGQPRTSTDRWFHQTAYNVADHVVSEGTFTSVHEFYVAEKPSLTKPWYNKDGTKIPQSALTHFSSDQVAVSGITQRWQDDLRILLHRDHGFRSASSGGWGTPSFTIKTVKNLPAPSIPPVVLSINCETGWYDAPTNSTDDHSLALELMRTANGASAVLGASRISWSGYNDRLAEGLMKAVWPKFVLDFDLADVQQPRTIGEMVQFAKVHTRKYYRGNYGKYTLELFNLFGDPEMPLTTEPRALSAVSLAGKPVDILSFPATPIWSRPKQ